MGKLVSGVYTAEVTPASFIVMVGTSPSTSGDHHERRCAKRLKSEVLAADANHTLSDALVSIVIVGLAAVALAFPWPTPSWRCGDCRHPGHGLRRIQARATTLSDHARSPDKDVRAVAMGVPGAGCPSYSHARHRGEVYADSSRSWRPG
ncbi:MAG: hypothetical protein ACLSVD_07475 [Eggerthellaceae bacterium]